LTTFAPQQYDTDLFSEMYLPLRKKLEEKQEKPKIIVIAGVTAVGKTELGIELAKILNGEIISADSMQVYRNMDIGTAKVSKEIRKEIPHHLIDICDLDEAFNVAKFYELATVACKDIIRRGKVPIVVGGTGFYIHALLFGMPPGPHSVPEIRSQLEKQLDAMGVDVMYERLQMIDPEYAKTITHHDRKKIIRGLEIIAISHKKVSDFPLQKYLLPNWNYRLWFLHAPREVLYEKIEKRCYEIIDLGLIEEVKSLVDQGLLLNESAMNAIGYRQTLEYLRSNQTKQDYEIFLRDFIKATKKYSKRQITWYRKEKGFRWLDMGKYPKNQVLEYILQDYEQS